MTKRLFQRNKCKQVKKIDYSVRNDEDTARARQGTGGRNKQRDRSTDSSRLEPCCTEGSVSEAGVLPTEEKRTSVSQNDSSWADVGNKAD